MHAYAMIFPAFIQGIGTPELLIIFFVILLIFGAKKLPELARGMGKAINEFKKASSDIERDIKGSIKDDEHEKTQSTAAAEAHTASKAEESSNKTS